MSGCPFLMSVANLLTFGSKLNKHTPQCVGHRQGELQCGKSRRDAECGTYPPKVSEQPRGKFSSANQVKRTGDENGLSQRHAQRFLSAFGIITSHFRPGRHLCSADVYRPMMTTDFACPSPKPEEIVLLAVMRLGATGYGAKIRQKVSEATDRNVSIGAVNATLDRLERKGYIKSFKARPHQNGAAGQNGISKLRARACTR
jgi:hypothetical protein